MNFDGSTFAVDQWRVVSGLAIRMDKVLERESAMTIRVVHSRQDRVFKTVDIVVTEITTAGLGRDAGHKEDLTLEVVTHSRDDFLIE